ncbi:unnamed protein product [Rotaria sp. Silwood2]|nr:unnamed protein product [Rotaria sp. Silwood2]
MIEITKQHNEIIFLHYLLNSFFFLEVVLPAEKTLDIERKVVTAVEYLKSIEAFPNTQLIALNEKKFTGQFICSIVLVHIDLHNQLHARSQFERGSMNGAFSFELESETFK